MGLIVRFGQFIARRDFVAAESLVINARLKEESTFMEFLNDDAENPLVLASGFGAFGVVRRLIDYGADVNINPEDGFTPIFMAIDASLIHPAGLACLAYLLKSGADPNMAGIGGIRPLSRAAVEGCHSAFQLLIAYGADPFLPDDDDHFPDRAYDVISKRKLEQFMETLRDAGKILNGLPVEK